MSSLDDALTALDASVAANTTAVNAFIAAFASSAPSEAQVAAVKAASDAVAANTTAINNTLNPPATEPDPNAQA